MKPEPILEDLFRLLAQWHKYESGWMPVDGYPSECPSTRGYRASRQYDSDNGAGESEAHARMLQHIGNVINGMPQPHQIAIRIIARNRATGANVWTSARLPQDEQQRAQLFGAALEIFQERI